jgi:hypothetical protein
MPFGGITIFRIEGLRRTLYNIITEAAECTYVMSKVPYNIKLQVMTLNNEITTQNITPFPNIWL